MVPRCLRLLVFAAAACLPLAAVPCALFAGPEAPQGAAASPLFGVAIPQGYRGWQVVAPSHRPDKDEIRLVLANDVAMAAYRAGTLPFPDGAVLAKLAWKRVKSAEFADAFVPGAPQRIEFMVKDSKRYAATGGWGFGRFVDGRPADEAQHRSCFPCHEANVKGHDFVFTRLAP